MIINDNDVCQCGAYWNSNGYCSNGHPRIKKNSPRMKQQSIDELIEIKKKFNVTAERKLIEILKDYYNNGKKEDVAKIRGIDYIHLLHYLGLVELMVFDNNNWTINWEKVNGR